MSPWLAKIWWILGSRECTSGLQRYHSLIARNKLSVVSSLNVSYYSTHAMRKINTCLNDGVFWQLRQLHSLLQGSHFVARKVTFGKFPESITLSLRFVPEPRQIQFRVDQLQWLVIVFAWWPIAAWCHVISHMACRFDRIGPDEIDLLLSFPNIKLVNERCDPSRKSSDVSWCYIGTMRHGHLIAEEGLCRGIPDIWQTAAVVCCGLTLDPVCTIE